MKVEGARIFIGEDSLTRGANESILFVDCGFTIADLPDETLIFINCYHERCSFNISLHDVARISSGGFLRDCTFREDEAQGVTDAPSS